MSPERRLRTIIVDDERLARQRLKDLLVRDPEIQIVGECANGTQAIRLLRGAAVDLMFLDVQMPEVDGFGVLRAIAPERLPVTVFVTAYEQYAVNAFEANAVDYVLKPFHRPRFFTAVQRAKSRCQVAELQEFQQRVADLLAERPRLAVSSGRGTLLIPLDEIDWIEAANNYVCVHCGNRTHIGRETLRNLEERLRPHRFVRIHRSTLVNADSVRELQPRINGDFDVYLRDGVHLIMSRTYGASRDQLLPSL